MDTVLHFPPSLEEVNLSVTNDRVWLRNHIEDDAGISVYFILILQMKLNEKEFNFLI